MKLSLCFAYKCFLYSLYLTLNKTRTKPKLKFSKYNVSNTYMYKVHVCAYLCGCTSLCTYVRVCMNVCVYISISTSCYKERPRETPFNGITHRQVVTLSQQMVEFVYMSESMYQCVCVSISIGTSCYKERPRETPFNGITHLQVVTLSQQMVAFVPGPTKRQLGGVQLFDQALDLFWGIVFVVHQVQALFTDSGEVGLAAFNLRL